MKRNCLDVSAATGAHADFSQVLERITKYRAEGK